jgi:hypothetical protein
LSEVMSRRTYTFKPRHGHQLYMGAAEIRAAVLNLGQEVLGSNFEVEILSEDDNTIEVRCEAATGEIVYEMDSKLMYRILNFCERNNLDFSVEEMEARSGRMDEYI